MSGVNKGERHEGKWRQKGGAQAGDLRTCLISVLGMRTITLVMYTLAQSCSVSCPSRVLERVLACFSVDSRATEREGGIPPEIGIGGGCFRAGAVPGSERFSCLHSPHTYTCR